jgi:hypothetical protein
LECGNVVDVEISVSALLEEGAVDSEDLMQLDCWVSASREAIGKIQTKNVKKVEMEGGIELKPVYRKLVMLTIGILFSL